MPYESVADLPDAVCASICRRMLSTSIWRSSTVPGMGMRSMPMGGDRPQGAWSVVKKQYVKRGDQWVKKERPR